MKQNAKPPQPSKTLSSEELIKYKAELSNEFMQAWLRCGKKHAKSFETAQSLLESSEDDKKSDYKGKIELVRNQIKKDFKKEVMTINNKFCQRLGIEVDDVYTLEDIDLRLDKLNKLINGGDNNPIYSLLIMAYESMKESYESIDEIVHEVTNNQKKYDESIKLINKIGKINEDLNSTDAEFVNGILSLTIGLLTAAFTTLCIITLMEIAPVNMLKSQTAATIGSGVLGATSIIYTLKGIYEMATNSSYNKGLEDELTESHEAYKKLKNEVTDNVKSAHSFADKLDDGIKKTSDAKMEK